MVFVFKQLLCAIAKSIQWSVPSKYGIKKLVLIMGQLHTEIFFLNVIGDWLETSRWITLIRKCQSNKIWNCAVTSVWISFSLD